MAKVEDELVDVYLKVIDERFEHLERSQRQEHTIERRIVRLAPHTAVQLSQEGWL